MDEELRRSRGSIVGDGVLAVLGVGTLTLVIWAVFFPDQLPSRAGDSFEPPSPVTTPQVTASAPAIAPTSQSAGTISNDPAAVTLRVTDLPGYHVLQAGPAVLTAGAGRASPAGWDVIFAPDPGSQMGYLLVESAVAVYADAEAAWAALEAESAAEEAANAVPQSPVPALADEQADWIEPAPDRPGYGIARLTWQSLNIVGQVAVLGPIGPGQTELTDQLAMVEQDRIRSMSSGWIHRQTGNRVQEL